MSYFWAVRETPWSVNNRDNTGEVVSYSGRLCVVLSGL